MTPERYSVLKWGALLGGPLAVLETLLALLAFQAHNAADMATANCLGTPLEIVLPLIAGLLAGRETGNRIRGLQAGLLVGAIVAAANMLTELLVPGVLTIGSDGTPVLTTMELVGGTLITRLLTLGWGAWGGWLGGRLGMALPPQKPPQKPPGRP
ncbi:MAG: hypothetical protein M3Z04_08460 [Chloroflexota bacterium]|nr:hypothetical protein [Chloroflexota bacterium]